MARKRRSFLALQAALAGLTFVDSKTYPAHNRNPRGTHKDAPCNKVLQENSEKTHFVTALASPLLLQFKELAGSFAHKQLWQQLTGRMFKAPSTDIADLLKSLEGLELNCAYPFSRVASPLLFHAKKVKREMTLALTPQGSVFFPARLKMDSYFYSITILWIDCNGKQMIAETIETEWIGCREFPRAYEMTFVCPPWAGYYLLLAGVQAGRGGGPVESFAAQGVQIVNSGIV